MNYVYSGGTILPVWWKDHVLMFNKSSNCVFCQDRILKDPKDTFIFNHDGSQNGDYDLKNRKYTIPICASCLALKKGYENETTYNDTQIGDLFQQRVTHYISEMSKDQFERLHTFVKTGLIPNVGIHIEKDSWVNKCFICHNKNSKHRRSHLGYNFDYVHVPVGQSSTITPEVIICKPCLDACYQHQIDLTADHMALDTDIVLDKCHLCESEYFITASEAQERTTLGTMGDHTCMDCMSPYIGSPRIIHNGVSCQTCFDNHCSKSKSIDLTLKQHRALSKLYLTKDSKEPQLFVDWLCQKVNTACALNDTIHNDMPEILRLEDMAKNTHKEKKKQVDTSAYWDVLERVQFTMPDYPIIVKLEKISCKRFKESWIFKFVASKSHPSKQQGHIFAELSSKPQCCQLDGNESRKLCKCFVDSLDANLGSAYVFQNNLETLTK